MRDQTDLSHDAEQLLRNERARLQATYQHAPVCIIETDADGLIVAANPGLTLILGWTPDDVVGKARFHDCAAPGGDLEDRKLYQKLVKGEIDTYSIERLSTHKDGAQPWMLISCSAVRNESGAFLYGIRVLSDISERRRTEERLHLLNHELNHRVKNTLSLVQSMVRQTMRYSNSLEEFEQKLDHRLQGLATTHDLLTKTGFDNGAALADLVRAELAPFHSPESGRWTLAGPAVHLPSSDAVNFGMIVHELATNAVKYGALSEGGGRVAVSWTVREDDGATYVLLEWAESAGPKVTPPTRTGFGSRLLTALSRAMRGDLSLQFAEAGVAARLSFAL